MSDNQTQLTQPTNEKTRNRNKCSDSQSNRAAVALVIAPDWLIRRFGPDTNYEDLTMHTIEKCFTYCVCKSTSLLRLPDDS